MPKGIMFVQTKPSSSDREDEYNEWYSTVHLPEVCQVEGVVAAHRYKLLSPISGNGSDYLAIYQLEADDLSSVLENMTVQAQKGHMTMSDALGMDPPPVPVIYTLID
jgi:hypothetical protein